MSREPRVQIIGRVTGKIYDGDQVPGMPHAICHACGLKDYPCTNPDCPNASQAMTGELTEFESAELKALAELEAMIEGQRKQIDSYGLALIMIAEGCTDSQQVARDAINNWRIELEAMTPAQQNRGVASRKVYEQLTDALSEIERQKILIRRLKADLANALEREHGWKMRALESKS